MATKKYMSLERMVEYDALIKTKIDSGDESTLSSAKSYTDTEIKKIDDELTIVKDEFEAHTHSLTDIEEMEVTTSSTVLYDNTFTAYTSTPMLTPTKNLFFYTGKKALVTFNGETYTTTCDHGAYIYFGDYHLFQGVVDDAMTLSTVVEGQDYTLKVEIIDETVSIPSSFINSDIARTEYVDTAIDSITGGSVVVKEAEHAASATKATQDGNGKVIASTYETKTDASAKLIEAKTYTDTVAAGKSDSNHNHDDKYDAKGAASTALDEAKAYTDTMTSGIASTAVVDNKISAHNTSTSAHTDIRDLISELSTKVNNFLDVDDATTDQLSEVLTLINNNKGTLDSITSSKVNVSDIVDNLTTSSTTKVLSAKQGVALKALIDALQTAVDGKAAEGHGHAIADVTNLQSTLNAKAAQTDLDEHEADAVKHITSVERTNWNAAKTHADSAHAPSNAQANVIENIKVNGTAQTITSKAVNITVPTKASDIGAAEASHGTHVEYSTTAPVMDGTASAGSASTVARSDHKHPTDTSRASQVALDELAEVVDGKADSVHVHDVATSSANGFMSSTMFTKLNGIEDGATKVIVDTALNATSSNAIANSVVTSNINTLSQAIQTNAGGITTNANSIKALEESIVEITSEEIQALFAS